MFQWARDSFEGLFTQPAELVTQYIRYVLYNTNFRYALFDTVINYCQVYSVPEFAYEKDL